jgi:hypothetical protein
MAKPRRTTAIIGVVVLVVAACGPTVVVPPGPILDTPPGLQSRLTVADVSAIAFSEIHMMETIAGRVLRPPRILRVTANRGGPAAPGFDPVTWIVFAEGTFATNRGPSQRVVPLMAPTGQFEISDADGSILSWGFPADSTD